MIRRLPFALPALLLAGFATPALSAGQDALSSTYWDASYLSQKIEADGSSASVDAEGFRLGLGIGLMKFLNLSVDYDQVSDHGDRVGFGSGGLAYHTQNPVYQFIGGVTYERTEQKSAASEEGYGVEIGGRYMLPNVELHAAYRYIDYGKVNGTEVDLSGSRYAVGADVQLCPWWSLVADYRAREVETDGAGVSNTTEFSGFSVGFRRYFVSSVDRRARSGGVLNSLFSGGGDEDAPAAE